MCRFCRWSRWQQTSPQQENFIQGNWFLYNSHSPVVAIAKLSKKQVLELTIIKTTFLIIFRQRCHCLQHTWYMYGYAPIMVLFLLGLNKKTQKKSQLIAQFLMDRSILPNVISSTLIRQKKNLYSLFGTRTGVQFQRCLYRSRPWRIFRRYHFIRSCQFTRKES